MMNYKKAKQMTVPEQNVEVDPRSKTTAGPSFQLYSYRRQGKS